MAQTVVHVIFECYTIQRLPLHLINYKGSPVNRLAREANYCVYYHVGYVRCKRGVHIMPAHNVTNQGCHDH